jgi:hypothetical protein
MAALALAPRAAAAQQLQANPFERTDAPALVLNFGAGHVRSLNQEFEDDLYALHAFGGKRRLDRFTISSLERPTPWKVYGRLGLLNFQNELEPQYSQGLRFSWRRTGPKLTGRVYIGIHRTFD